MSISISIRFLVFVAVAASVLSGNHIFEMWTGVGTLFLFSYPPRY